MSRYTFNYYVSPTGECPFEAFLNGLQDKQKAKCFYYMGRLVAEGLALSRNYLEYVEEDMWALRPEWANVEFRLFFTLHKGVFTFVHGITKKRTRIPQGEVELARRRISEWKGRS